MTKAQRLFRALVFTVILSVAACNPQGAVEPTPPDQATAEWEAQALETLAALNTPATATEKAIPPTHSPSPSTTITLTATLMLTSTQEAPLLSVSANTHCRTGPGMNYDPKGVLFVGQDAQVLAQSTIEDYWYIRLPDKPDQPCWLSGAYATVEGDTSLLPSYTPVPTPTPEVGFDLYLHGFESCGSTFYVVFSVQNGGANILKSGTIEIIAYESRASLYGPTYQRFPFAEYPTPVCPPGHGNVLYPGQIQYIHVPINPVPHGERARGTVKLCTGDYQGGECVTKDIYFFIQ